MEGVLMIVSMDHTQFQSINGLSLLSFCYTIPCFQTVALEHSVRVSTDTDFVRIQEVTRMNYQNFDEDSNLVDECMTLCFNSCIFVDSWKLDNISSTTMRLYSKKIPTRESSRKFVTSVMR